MKHWQMLRRMSGHSHAVYNSAAKVIGFKIPRHHDWFDDQDAEARKLLDTMHATHLAWINDKSNPTKKSAYTRARSAALRTLRQMKNEWWANKAQELQQAAGQRDTKAFYQGLKAVYGPRDSGSEPVRSRDGTTLITDRAGILSRWAEHFHSVLNQPSSFDVSVLNLIPNWAVNMDLIQPPNFIKQRTRWLQASTRDRRSSGGGVQRWWTRSHCQADSAFPEHLEQAVGSAGIQRCANCAYLQEERRLLSV